MNTATPIDMLTPTQTAARLELDDDALLALVNGGRLPAYDLGGSIRFKAVDVAACARRLVAA